MESSLEYWNNQHNTNLSKIALTKGQKTAACDILAAATFGAIACMDGEPISKIYFIKMAISAAAGSIGGSL